MGSSEENAKVEDATLSDEEFDDVDGEDCPDIEMLDLPPRYLDWGKHWPLTLTDEYRIVVSYGMATEDQKRAIFPKRRAKTDVLTHKVFDGQKCYELWVDGDLVGLCDVSVSGWNRAGSLTLIANLDAVYLKGRFRKKGLLRPFLEVVGWAVNQELMTYVMRAAQAGTTAFEVTVEADLYSLGGQAAVRILGDQMLVGLENAADCAGLPIEVQIIDDAW